MSIENIKELNGFELRNRLESLGLSSEGKEDELRDRLLKALNSADQSSAVDKEKEKEETKDKPKSDEELHTIEPSATRKRDLECVGDVEEKCHPNPDAKRLHRSDDMKDEIPKLSIVITKENLAPNPNLEEGEIEIPDKPESEEVKKEDSAPVYGAIEAQITKKESKVDNTAISSNPLKDQVVAAGNAYNYEYNAYGANQSMPYAGMYGYMDPSVYAYYTMLYNMYGMSQQGTGSMMQQGTGDAMQQTSYNAAQAAQAAQASQQAAYLMMQQAMMQQAAYQMPAKTDAGEATPSNYTMSPVMNVTPPAYSIPLQVITEADIHVVPGILTMNSVPISATFTIPHHEDGDFTLENQDNTTLFVGGMPGEVDEGMLMKYFSQFGPVQSIVLKRNAQTGASKGFGFIQFKNHISVDDVLACGSHVFFNKRIDLHRYESALSRKDTKLTTMRVFIGGVDESMTEDVLKEAFKPYGTVKSVSVVRKQDGKNRGFAFATFDSPDVAQMLIKKQYVTVNGRQLFISSANDKKNKQPNVSRNGMNPYYGGGYGYF